MDFLRAYCDSESDSGIDSDNDSNNESECQLQIALQIIKGTSAEGGHDSSSFASSEIDPKELDLGTGTDCGESDSDSDIESDSYHAELDDNNANDKAPDDSETDAKAPRLEEESYDMVTLLANVVVERDILIALCPPKVYDDTDIEKKSRRCRPFPYGASTGILTELKDRGYEAWIGLTVKKSGHTVVEQSGQFIAYCRGKLKTKCSSTSSTSTSSIPDSTSK